jgi:hypothetical protein
MRRKRFWVLALLALSVVTVLVGAAASVLRLGWGQGYAMGGWIGQHRSEAYPGCAWPHTRSLLPYRSRLGLLPFLCGLGLLFEIGLAVLLVTVLVHLFRPRAWGPTCAPVDWQSHGPPHWHCTTGHDAERTEPFSAKAAARQQDEPGPGSEADSG